MRPSTLVFHDSLRNAVESNRAFFWPSVLLTALAVAGCSGTESNGSGSGGGVSVGGSSNSSSTGGTSNSGQTTGGTTASMGGAPQGTTGGQSNGTGGSSSAGGSNAVTGGAPPSGGSSNTGGTSAAGGTSATGGKSATGGVAATGGKSSSSGGATTGGLPATGGASTTGGTAAGGTSATGGKSATGGLSSAGGTSATGGKSATGGTSAGGAATGGSSATTGGSNGGAQENSGTNCNATAGATKKNTKLPDPFAMHDGTRITTKAQWECRRNEIKKDIEKYEIGVKQEPPTVAATLSGTTLSVKVTTSASTITLTSTVSGSGSCVVIGMNGNSGLVSGCVQIPFMHDQVVTYEMSGTQTQSDPYYKLYPSEWGKIGNYSAWSWGISRLIDGIVQLKDQLKVDPTKIAVHGCSYAGKMALFAGAFDERVALTIAQESGGGGINSWRTSQDYTTRTGVNIEKINNTSGSWFLKSMLGLDPYSLPHDHHELIAMVAPRAIIALGNADYDWLGDESGYKSIMAAKQVWIAMGLTDSIGFDFTSGHTHCQAATSQINSVNAFVNRFLKGQTANTNIAIQPTKSGFDLNYSSVIDWTTPTLQ